ncbi:MAG: GNAT family N-acetyltransferase [Spirochaetes bacterium]|nr:GNAT family N-acetyltransferase [Spirochaetota bacterium]
MKQSIFLRKAGLEDKENLFKWANESTTRQMSFNSEPITWEQHIEWFEKYIDDDHHLILIMMNEEKDPVGVIRFEIQKDEAVIAITIALDKRGKGYAVAGLKESIQYLFQKKEKVKSITAFIKHENRPSLGAFLKAGFKEKDPDYNHKGFKCYYLIYNRTMV